jgi:hypothetical protein
MVLIFFVDSHSSLTEACAGGCFVSMGSTRAWHLSLGRYHSITHGQRGSLVPGTRRSHCKINRIKFNFRTSVSVFTI